MSNMTEARVFELIEVYGPEPAAWPDAEREAASTLLRSSPAVFEEALADTRALDAALAAIPEPSVPAGLAERIIATGPKPAAARPGIFSQIKSLFSIDGSLIPTASGFASAALGLVIGYGALGTTQLASVDSAEEAVYVALDAGFGDFEIGDLN